MKVHKIIAAPCIIAAALVITACSGKHTADAHTARPCDALTAGEVSSRFGIPIKTVTQIGPDRCRYVASDQIDMLTVRASSTGGQTEFRGGQLGRGLLGIKTGPNAGVGDESFWDGRILWARKGDAFVVIDMRLAPVDPQKAGPDLARTALSNL